MNVYFYSTGIVFTRRVLQALAVALLITLAALAKRSFDHVFYGVRMLEAVFLLVFILTYFREQRRALYDANSAVTINWNLFEAVLFLSSILGYLLFAVVHRYSYDVFYGYFNPGGIGMLTGIALGEWLWQNTRLRHLDEQCRERYWKNYKDRIW